MTTRTFRGGVAGLRLQRLISFLRRNRLCATAHASHILYHRLKPKAVEVIMGLVAKCPELQAKARLPRCTLDPAYIMSLGPQYSFPFSYRSRDKDGIFRLERESLVHFDAAHLRKLVREGRWCAACRYLGRFSPLWEPEGEGTNRQYTALVHSLGDHSLLEFLACRQTLLLLSCPSHVAFPSDEAFRTEFHDIIQRHELYRSMTSAQARASVDWDTINLTTRVGQGTGVASSAS